MAQKSLFLSKTFWFTLITGLLAALLPAFPALAPMKDWIAANSILVGTVWTILGVVLRMLTKGAVVLVDA